MSLFESVFQSYAPVGGSVDRVLLTIVIGYFRFSIFFSLPYAFPALNMRNLPYHTPVSNQLKAKNVLFFELKSNQLKSVL